VEQETWMTRADRQTAARRRAQVLQARLAGASFEDIGRQLGVSDTRAHQLYVDALRRTVQEPADRLRDLELQRLDQLQAHATYVLRDRHVLVQAGRVVVDPLTGRPLPDPGPGLAAVAALLRIGERRAKLLGLDAPTSVNARLGVTLADATVADIDEELAAVTAELARLPDPTRDQLTEPPAPPPPAAAPPVVPELAELVAAALDAALDAGGIPQESGRREAAYRAAEAQLRQVDR
jgi:hypothetical protein